MSNDVVVGVGDKAWTIIRANDGCQQDVFVDSIIVLPRSCLSFFVVVIWL